MSSVLAELQISGDEDARRWTLELVVNGMPLDIATVSALDPVSAAALITERLRVLLEEQ